MKYKNSIWGPNQEGGIGKYSTRILPQRHQVQLQVCQYLLDKKKREQEIEHLFAKKQ